jgi:cytochrome c oxidase cbb3-type subunit III
VTRRIRLFSMVAAGCILMAAQEPQPPAGRGGRGRVPGRSPDGFPQFIRPAAPQDVVVRGKGLYEANCAACHATDLRGVAGKGNNLMRSPVAMNDQHGELIGADLAKHNPPLNLAQPDVTAVSEYLHSMLATMGPQGSPPGRNPVGIQLNVLVGDAHAGQVYFDSHCAGCHSVTGDLKGIGAKYPDARALQNAWVAGTRAGANPFAGRGGGGRGGRATVTMRNGEKVEGTLAHEDDFLVILTLANGTRRAFPIEDGWPKVEVADPQAPHKKMLLELDDPENKNLHDVTAYLATLK